MKKKLIIILFIITLAFIWGHSMMPVAVSSAESGSVLNFIKPFLEIFVGKGNATDHIVRKMAHFIEYGALGVELAWIFVTSIFFSRDRAGKISLSGLNVWIRSIIAIIIAFFIGCIDEIIQIFSKRGPGFGDVLLDTAGATTGILIVTIVVIIRRKIISKNK